MFRKKTEFMEDTEYFMSKYDRHLPSIDGNDFNQWIPPNLRQIQSRSPQPLPVVLLLTQQSHRVTFNTTHKPTSAQGAWFRFNSLLSTNVLMSAFNFSLNGGKKQPGRKVIIWLLRNTVRQKQPCSKPAVKNALLPVFAHFYCILRSVLTISFHKLWTLPSTDQTHVFNRKGFTRVPSLPATKWRQN